MPNIASLNVSEVNSPKDMLNILLCAFYLKGSCTRATCNRLHFCKEFLVNQRKCNQTPCQYGFSHNPLDRHNKKVIDQCNSAIPRPKILPALRKSLPRICMDYQNNECQYGGCSKLHLCFSFVQNNVCTLPGCQLCHDFSDLHNSVVLNGYPKLNGIKHKKGDLFTNIFFSKTVSIKDHQEQKKQQQLQQTSISAEVVETIYKSLLSNPTGSKKLESADPDVVTFFKNAPNYFRLDENPHQTMIYACPKDLKPCFYYWREKTGCNSVVCSAIHICKRQLFDDDNGCTKAQCTLNHDFQRDREKQLLQKFRLDGLDNNEVRLLLKIRYPIVCERYLNDTCGYGTSCSCVHVCVKFLQGQCGGCRLQHEGGLNNAHAKRLMKAFHIEEKNFRSCVMIPRPNSELYNWLR